MDRWVTAPKRVPQLCVNRLLKSLLRPYLHCARLQTRKSFNNQVVII